MKEYALVTGASSGIGRSIALQLAQRGYVVMLTARSEDKLKDLADEIKTRFDVDAVYLPLDLSLNDAAVQLISWCESLAVTPAILINNAGYGLWGDFAELNLNEQVNMHRLNTEAVIRLTHAMLPILKRNKRSYILNVSSTAAYQPVPTLGLYAAGKSFVLSFSRALRYELKQSPVSVSCLCPGPTDTGFTHRAGLDAFADLAAKFNMSADEVAAIGLKGMFKGRTEIVPGFLNKLTSIAARHAPKAFAERISASLYKR